MFSHLKIKKVEMNINLLDKSNYLKGLFITARKDKQLTETEKSILKKLSQKLGFANDFYEETISGLLANKYIPDDPIKFNDSEVAKSFLGDALKLIYSDGCISDVEINWLKETAEVNNIDISWFEEQHKKIKEIPAQKIASEFSLYSII